MSFQTTPARSSRVSKPRKLSAAAAMGLRRSVSSPTSAIPRKKSSSTHKLPTTNDEEKLHDSGIMVSLASNLNFRDVPQYMEYIRRRMFDPIPEKSSGMNSTRTAEVLNFRKALPPIVTIAHVDALCTSSTRTEREIVELSQAGVLRRLTIPYRGAGANAVGDGLASVMEWEKLIKEHADIDEALQSKYTSTLANHPTSTTIPNTAFTPSEITILTGSGFLTSTTILSNQSSLFASLSTPGSLSSLSTAGSRHAAGSLEAVGGASASQHIYGNGVSSGRHTSAPSTAAVTYYNFSLPNTGSHIKLLIEARSHFLSLLKKTKHKEASLDTLRERWDGGIINHDGVAEKKRARREFAGILPGRTKKWRQFYGLRFEWILEECVGAGLIELFETGSVGKAVRML